LKEIKVSEREILEWFDSLSNWGRWGPDEELGTLNLITNEKRRYAAGLVRDGVAVSCSRTINYSAGPENHFPTRHVMQSLGERPPGAVGRGIGLDYFIIGVHGVDKTHLDAPSHTVWRSDPGQPWAIYNGKPASSITYRGAGVGSIELAGEGIVTRGVLLDMPLLRGVDWLEPGTSLHTDDLEQAEARFGVRVEPGDALLVRTGWLRRLESIGLPDPIRKWTGIDASCLPWLRERDVAVLSCEPAQDANPDGGQFSYPEIGFPIHGVGMAALGLWLLDNPNLEDLAMTCQRLERWDFMLSVAPLKLAQATGSPVNPIALF
jgi:kynurenine formamidase